MIREEIALTVQVQDQVHDIVTYTGEYRNLMSLIFDRIYLEYFGDCRGMGRCGTCIVEIIQSPKELSAMDEKEEGVIGYLVKKDYPIRLSCQILVTTDLHDAIIRVVDPA